ncbi:hypothetical protein D3C73_1406910 [compost metagenome]
MGGQVEHFLVDVDVGHVIEGLVCRSHLVIEIQGRADQAIAMRADQQRSKPAEQYRAGNGRDLRFFHSVTEQSKGLFAHLLWCQIVGLVEIDVIDLVARNECRD